MPECANCGSHVSERYARVFVPEEFDRPQVCPNCEELKRDKRGGVRQKRT